MHSGPHCTSVFLLCSAEPVREMTSFVLHGAPDELLNKLSLTSPEIDRCRVADFAVGPQGSSQAVVTELKEN